jgi:acyl carrier protein
MGEQEIAEKLQKIFRKIFGNDAIVIFKEMTASDVENWNSLNNMILISEIEKAFSIKFQLKELNKMRRVGDMIEIINSKLQN